jgi:hypothetical protein
MKNRRMDVHAYIISGGGRKFFMLEKGLLDVGLRRSWMNPW